MVKRTRTLISHMGIVAFIAMATPYCSSKTSSSAQEGGTTTGGTGSTTGGGSSTTTTGGTTPTTRQAAVGGTASNQLASNSGSTYASLLSVNACAAQDFNVYEVGGGGSAIAAAHVNNDGSFSVQWDAAVNVDSNAVAEVTLRFACATSSTPTVRCFGKPGDGNITCDPISNAIITALETSLGVSVEGSSDFKGLSVATLAQGLVETLKLASNLDPSVDYLTELATATNPNDLADIINASPVGALFSTLQTVTVQTQVQNTSPAGNSNTAKSAALQALWTPEKVVKLLTGLGLSVNFNVDDSGDNGPNIYGPLSTAIDNATGTTFIVDFETYLKTLYTNLYVSGTAQSSAISLLCVAQADGNSSNSVVTYPPDLSSTDANMITCTGPAAYALGLVTSVGGDPNGVSISALISSSFTETDRNDPDGTHGQGQQFNLSIGLVDVFDEIQTAIEPNGVCASFVDNAGDNGPGPNTNWTMLGDCFKTNGLGSYFAGVMGVYSFLTNPDLQNVRISFVDIYQSLISNLALRLTAAYPYFNNGIEVTLTDYVSSGGSNPTTVWVPQLLLDTNARVGGDEVYQSYCPAPLCDSSGLLQQSASMTVAQFNDLLAHTAPSLQGLFAELLNMPSFGGLRDWIFNAGHHVEYNTSGSHFYNIIGKDTNSDFQADKPILCQVLDANTHARLASYGAGNTIDCQVATGNWNNGVVTDANYALWFGLQWRSGTGAERYFSLVNLYTGMDVQVNGQEFRIRDTSSQLQATANLSTGPVAVVPNGANVYTGTDLACSYNAASQTQCYPENFSYVALRFPNSNAMVDANSFYPITGFQPFSWPMQIAQIDPVSGRQHDVQLQIAATNGTHDNTVTNLAAGYPLCIGASGVVTSDINPGVVSAISLAGHIGNCADDRYSSGVHYFLALTFDANTATATNTNYYYQLVRSDGLFMSAQCTGGNTGISSNPNRSGNSNASTPLYCAPYTVPLLTLLSPLESLALFPSAAPVQALSYSIANPKYSPSFDPFCADLDNSGNCDCLRDDGTGTFDVHLTASSNPTDADCNLSDIPGTEPTFSNPPINSTDPTAPLLARVMHSCGNLSGHVLATCINTNDYPFAQLTLNATALFACATPVPGQALTYVNVPAVIEDPNNAGGNCNPNNMPGPVTLYKIINRNNAFDISHPQAALKLISSATQDTGTGIKIDANAASFSFNEALALSFFRLTVPLDRAEVQGPSPTLLVGAQAAAQVTYPGLQPTFTQVNQPNSNSSNITSAILRAFLTKTH